MYAHFSIAAGRLLSYIGYQLYTAKSGLQTGLAGFTTTDNSANNMSEGPQPISKTLSAEGPQSLANTLSVDSGVGSLDRVDSACSVNREASFSEKKSVSVCVTPSSFNAQARSPAKAGDPKFLNEFYSNSRLHHLSTWKSEWKDYVNQIQSKESNFEGREKLRSFVHTNQINDLEEDPGEVIGSDQSEWRRGKRERCVMHVDMDCFFVSVGLTKRPDLKGIYHRSHDLQWER